MAERNNPASLKQAWMWLTAFCLMVIMMTAHPADAVKRGTMQNAGATAASVPNALSLQDCINLALENNHTRSVSRLSIEIAEAQHRQAVSAYWPRIGIKSAYTVMDDDPNFVFPASTVNTSAMTTTIQTPLGPMPVSIPPSTINIPRQDVKLMDRENFYATLNATLPLYTGGKISSVVRRPAKCGKRPPASVN
jgi:outer membrane protein